LIFCDIKTLIPKSFRSQPVVCVCKIFHLPIGDELEWALNGEDGGEHVVKIAQGLKINIFITHSVFFLKFYLPNAFCVKLMLKILVAEGLFS